MPFMSRVAVAAGEAARLGHRAGVRAGDGSEQGAAPARAHGQQSVAG